MSAKYHVRKNQTVRYENPTGTVTYLRITSVTSQSAVTLDAMNGKANISAVPKSTATTPALSAGAKRVRHAWVNA